MKQKARILDAIENLNFRVRKKIIVLTYHQDEDAQHQAVQDDNPIITELIHIDYSLDDISKTETPIVIEEDETLMVEATTKLHKVQIEDNNIMPEHASSKDSPLKEIQHQIVPVSRDKSDNVISFS
ncbi:hypothetical protein Tco_1436977 [Tanacetum coccineum]